MPQKKFQEDGGGKNGYISLERVPKAISKALGLQWNTMSVSIVKNGEHREQW